MCVWGGVTWLTKTGSLWNYLWHYCCVIKKTRKYRQCQLLSHRRKNKPATICSMNTHIASCDCFSSMVFDPPPLSHHNAKGVVGHGYRHYTHKKKPTEYMRSMCLYNLLLLSQKLLVVGNLSCLLITTRSRNLDSISIPIKSMPK